MADPIVSLILEQLKATIINKAKEEVSLIVGVEEEVKKLERNLDLIRGVLADAEEKKTKDEVVKKWLNRLREASYDMEDALDEWRTAVELEALYEPKKAASASRRRKVPCNFLSCFSCRKLGTRYEIALNIKEINQRLDDIAKEKDRYHLKNKEVELPKRPESSSFVDVSHIWGRDGVKRKILRYLFEGHSSEPFETISIVGFGGLGKTAMAQLAYNDHAIQKHFDNVTWVSVSNFFDEKKVAKGIIQGLEKISGSETYGLEAESLQVLLERILNSVKGKKFLLVLDDVWAERGETWESIKVTLKSGAPGSRILVTTRDVNVARMMGSSFSQIFLLEKVDDEVCWLILKEIALGGRKDWRNLEEIGRKIAIKCKGLPLAAKTLGSHLKSRRTKQQWEDVLNSEIWKLDLAQKDIFAPLFLSYYDLPPPVRQCFMYCVIYPKNHLIWVRDLIDRWMAQGYLGFDNDADLESIGQHYFDILASRSFFQDFEHHEHGTLLTCKMHDMIHDFAWYLVENEFVTKEVQSDNITIELEKSHHFTLVLHDKMSFPSSISGAEKLRSLVIFSVGGSGRGNSILELLPSLLNQSRRLRLLDFRYARDYLGKKVPKEIGKLIHLRQLDLSFTLIEELPEALSNLLNLLNLDFMGCKRLKELPSWISKLLNLRFLRTSACHTLTHYPKVVGRLTSLRNLLEAIVRADCINDAEQFSFADIGNMKHLRSICLKVMGDKINKDDARKSQLQNIQELRIYLTGKLDKDDIVEALDPPSDVNLQFNNNYWFH